MEITLNKQSANQALVKIKLNEADYQPKVDAKLKDYAKKAVIRGFRPGKAPFSMVKNMYGTSLLVDEINQLLGESLNNYIKEQTFKILGEPLPVALEDNSIDWKTQKEFEFEYKIGFVDSINLTLDNSLKGTKYSILVDEKLVNETLDNLKAQYGENSNPETSEIGDFIYGDLATKEGDFTKAVSLDTSKISKKLGAKFSGIAKEAVVEFESKEVKKEELTSAFGLSEEEAENVKGSLTFTVQNINRTTSAEMNQEFFDKIFGVLAEKTSFSPFIAVWTPNLFFGILAYYLLRNAKR